MPIPSPIQRTSAAAALAACLACAPAAEQAAPGDGSPPAPATAAGDPIAEVEAWRADRDRRLRQTDGWLSLAGLFWLEPGESTFGSGADRDLVFPEGKIAAEAGLFRRDGRRVTLVPGGGDLTIGGEPVEAPRRLASDADDDGPTQVEAGSLLFYVIERGERVGVRLKDRESPLLAAFEGMEYFPVDPTWRLTARYERFDEPRILRTPNVLGTVSEEEIAGAVVFEAGGEEHRLLPSGDPEDGFFLVFGDGTNGVETYGGGRFLYTDALASDGSVVVDFNKAYCPPCVFTPYATCPLPPRENKLALRIEAGEKSFDAGH